MDYFRAEKNSVFSPYHVSVSTILPNLSLCIIIAYESDTSHSGITVRLYT